MPQITKRQHYVPEFYLRQWADADGKITSHDLSNETVFSTNPTNTLLRGYFYEEDPKSPDNRIEKILSEMETACSGTFTKLAVESGRALAAGKGLDPASAVRGSITADDLNNLRLFAAYQYLRVPGAIDRKKFELEMSPIPDTEKAHALNPGRFVESGYQYVKNKFQSLKVKILLSLGVEFITSDWPCFDFKDSTNAPHLGEEIGTNPSVVCYMPLTPLLGAVFIPPHFSMNVAKAPTVMVSVQKNSIVRNQNTLVIQQADRYVIASREENFIFKIAAKRKKNSVT